MASIECRYGWYVVAASTVMIATAFGASYIVVVGMKPIAAEFGWPRQVPSAAYAVTMLGAGIGGIAMGLWSDRTGMGGPARLGALMIGLGAILVGISDTIYGFLAAHFVLIGLLGNGAMFSPLVSNITRWFDRRRGIAVAIVASGQSLAGACWPKLFDYTIEAYGWRESMIGYGVAAICIMVPLSFVLRRRPPGLLQAHDAGDPGRVDTGGQLLGLRPNTVQIMLSLAILGCCVAMSMPMVHIVAHCSDLGFARERGADMLAILLFCAFLSRIGYGWLADRIGSLATLLMGCSLQLLGLAMYSTVTSLEGLYAVSVFYGLGYGGIVPMYALIVRELFPQRQLGWRVGVVFLFGTVGMAIGGYLGGLLYDASGSYELAFLTGMTFNIANIAILSVLVWRARDSDRELAGQPA